MTKFAPPLPSDGSTPPPAAASDPSSPPGQASRPYGFLDALSGVPYPSRGHEIRQLEPDPDLCVRCERRPAVATRGVYCASCEELMAGIRDDARAEL